MLNTKTGVILQLSKSQCEFILGAKFCVLATCAGNQPRACIVIPERADGDKVIFADCQMHKTKTNILNNEKVFVSFYDDELDYCMKCDGVAKYIPEGALLEQIKSKLSRQGWSVAGLVEVTIKTVYEHKEN